MREALIVTGWVLGWLLLWRPPRVADRPVRPEGHERGGSVPGRDDGRGPAPTVAVVVPARDEADRLPLLLASLAAQEPPVDEVVVVDDHSRDATAAVAAAGGARVVAAPALPAGWTGKCWACAVGVDAVDADELVLLDADVVLAPDAVARARAARTATGGLTSVQPRHDVRRPVEALSLLFNVVGVMGLGLGTPVRSLGGWGAAGPLLVTATADYRAVGGHAAVRSEVAEDLALAARYRAAGLPVHCLLGGDRVRFRMYRDLGSLLQGWAKNMATGATRTPAVLGLAIAVWIGGLVAATVAVAGLVAGGTLAGSATALGLYAAVAAQVAVLGRRVGRFGPAAVLWPVLLAAFVAVVAWSGVATFVLRRVTWSDRAIHLPRRGRRHV